MAMTLRYGEQGELTLEVPGEVLIADWSAPRGAALDDPAAAVSAAVTNPIAFPPLTKATTPGDRIAVAVERSVPQANAVVAGVIHELLQGFAEAHEITIVVAPGTRPPIDGLPTELREQIQVEVHDPTDRQSLCYLAASSDGKPIYVNRQLFDADVVVPIGAMRDPQALAYFGVFGGLFPEFADEETRSRFRAPSSNYSSVHRRRRHEEVDEAAWLLGVQFSVQIIPGPGGGILHVLAGDAATVADEGERRMRAAWGFESPRRADLVVAAIEGGPDEQTWDNFARALFAAERVASEDAAIVICTELSSPPGHALRRLTAIDGDGHSLHDINRERGDDALSAALLAEVLERCNVYLLSELECDAVEELGLGFVSGPQDVARLAQRSESCILLGNAHFTAPIAQTVDV